MPAVKQRPVVVRLADGPCADTYATVRGFGGDCYQRLDKKAQVWLRYAKNLYQPGEYVWTGEALTTLELGLRIKQDESNTYGESRGA